jgi:hypothetical protein
MGSFWKLLLAIAACCFGIVGLLSGRPVERPAGILVERAPMQRPTNAAPFRIDEFEVVPRAEFDIEARVLSVESYTMDSGAKLSPLDFAVGWGPMSDSAVLEHFRISQGARFFTLYPDDAAIDIRAALLGSANIHLIPATARVRDRLERTRVGSIVRMRGYLVDVSGPNGYTWKTSLSREDTGAGACELLYVEQVEVL